MKKILLLGMIFAIVAALGVFAQDVCVDCCTSGPCEGGSRNTSTLDIYECNIRINDRVVKNDVVVLKAFERGEELDIRIEFASYQMAQDVQVMAYITGYHRSNKFIEQIFDITPTFSVSPHVSYEKRLRLKLPDDFRISTGDELKVRIEISDKFSKSFVREYNLKVEAVDHNVVIQDIILDPAGKVQAGRGLFASVRLRNMGRYVEEGMKVTVSIPALDLKATQYIDELETDKSTNSEDVFLRIPSCTKPGEYVMKVVVEYADGDEEVTKQTTIQVTEDPECELITKPTEDKTFVTVPGKQDVIIGTSGSVYPIIIENRGTTDRAYQLTATGLDAWATYRFDPSTYILVKGGQTETAYLYVTSKEGATPGEKVFMVTVETTGDKKQIALSANVIEGKTEKPEDVDWQSIRRGLEIGLIVLVVLLVVLGLIIGISKLKGDEDKERKEPEEISGQTYY